MKKLFATGIVSLLFLGLSYAWYGKEYNSTMTVAEQEMLNKLVNRTDSHITQSHNPSETRTAIVNALMQFESLPKMQEIRDYVTFLRVMLQETDGDQECASTSSVDYYCKNRQGVYNQSAEYLQYTDTDAFSFVDFGNGWAKDNNAVRWYGEQKKYDGRSFEVISEAYVKDSSGVYTLFVQGEPLLSNVDVASFEGIFNNYAKDIHSVYWLNIPIPQLDPATAQHLNDRFVEDKNGVYVLRDDQAYKIPSTSKELGVHILDDPAALHKTYITKQYFSADENQVYYLDRVVPEADASSFSLINEHFARDKDHLFCRNADITIGWWDGVDMIENVDVDTIDFIDRQFVSDGKNVYHFCEKIEGANPKTFDPQTWK